MPATARLKKSAIKKPASACSEPVFLTDTSADGGLAQLPRYAPPSGGALFFYQI
jgi:hypothetical protein